jgi:hypothetical protein
MTSDTFAARSLCSAAESAKKSSDDSGTSAAARTTRPFVTSAVFFGLQFEHIGAELALHAKEAAPLLFICHGSFE